MQHRQDVAPAQGQCRVHQYPELSEDEWKSVTARLAKHALCKVSRLYWRGLHSRGADDFAQDAILRVLDGRRKWDGQKDFFDFLCSVVDSIVDAAVSSFDNRRRKSLQEIVTTEGNENDLPDDLNDIDTMDIDEVSAARFHEAMTVALAKDPIARGIWDAIDNQFGKPNEIAELLGVPVLEIYSAKKRLMRVVKSAQRNQPRKGESHARRARCL